MKLIISALEHISTRFSFAVLFSFSQIRPRVSGTAAIELNRFGIPLRLIDKLLEPVTTSRAAVVQARTLELFEQRGLVDAMLEAGNKGIAASFYGHGKLLFRMEFSGIDSK
jgi:2-polyprenyl-6-methoxyphenol hydroxylase-like FAD-dependent oxidoreductase